MLAEVALSEAQIASFIENGFIRIDNAFPRDLAEACRRILWRATGADENDASTWNAPVIRIGEIPNPLFVQAANTPRLHAAYDALVGKGRWVPRGSLGTFPIRFPSSEDPGDTGFHVDMSFGFEDEPDFMAWRVNVRSKGRALLMLFLFSDVGEEDAPTVLRAGSHLDIARRLAPAGEAGLSLRELADEGFSESAHRDVTYATGPAGTVYLCHPFLVHAGQRHRGRTPKLMAQPALLPKGPLDPVGGTSPVERAIRVALGT